MVSMVVKAVLWVGSSREELRVFARDARQRAGYELYQLQRGLRDVLVMRQRRQHHDPRRSR